MSQDARHSMPDLESSHRRRFHEQKSRSRNHTDANFKYDSDFVLNNEMSTAWKAHLAQVGYGLAKTCEFIENEDLASFMFEVSRNTTLCSLDLSPAQKLAPGSGALLENLLRNATHLEVLNLLGNQLSCNARGLSDALTHNYSLRHLNMCNNVLDEQTTMALATALRHNTVLECLFIPVNHAADAGARALGQALAVNTTLKTLDISSNMITLKGFQELCEGMKDNSTLQTLSMSRNVHVIKGMSAQTLALIRVRTISLSYCGLLDDEGCILAEALKLNTTTWRKLDLANNRLVFLVTSFHLWHSWMCVLYLFFCENVISEGASARATAASG